LKREHSSLVFFVLLSAFINKYLVKKGKDTFFIPPRRGAAEAFQSLFSHTDGKILEGYDEDGCGRKVVGTESLILTQHSPYL
jgi:hypothetical protein